MLSESFVRLGMLNRSERVFQCGSLLKFAHEVDVDTGEISNKGKLHYANFCRDRLCPMCSWRRTLKIYSQASQIMERMPQNYDYLFLTLTVPNVDSYSLQATVDRLFKSWDRLNHHKRFKKSVKGFMRVLEITRNKKRGDFHPHFHVILVVDKEYFKKSDLYITHSDWLDMWRTAYDDDSITQVDIRRVRNKHKDTVTDEQISIASAVAETAKYAVKDSDYILGNKRRGETDQLVELFGEVLHNRRLVQYGGIFKQIAKELKFKDDVNDEDLTHINEKINPNIAQMIVTYGWSSGAYQIINTFFESEETK